MDEDDAEMKEVASSPEFCGAEEFLVGLSPGYWSHIPLTILDVNNMKMMAGVNCIVRESTETANNDINKNNTGKLYNACNSEVTSLQCYPVSKCTLVGMIVFAEAKANNSFFYVLDDGTGFIDCLAWGQGEDSIYSLPALGETIQYGGIATGGGSRHDGEFCVGDLVRVMGRIECVSVSDTKQELPLNRSSTNTTSGQEHIEMRDCIHEIHVNIMEKLSNSDRDNNELNWEANHWVKSIAATKVAPDPQSHKSGLRHASHVLEWLGPKTRSDVENRRNFPSADDTVGEWRVFGVSCQCELSYKSDLLYCHCQAKAEPLDPNFVYRDAVLNVLLEMERIHHTERLDDMELHKKVEQEIVSLDFRFQYRTISNHGHLCQVAKSVTSGTENPRLLSERLVVSTFRALRQDGIIHLLNEKTDTYLFISRKSVLDPYLRRCTGRKGRGNRLPSYLRDVPRARMEYLKRCKSLNKTY